MLVVYMPIIQEATHAYVQLWNHHHIQKQPNQPNAVTGFPYHYPPPGVSLYEIPISQEYISGLEASLEKCGKELDSGLPYLINHPHFQLIAIHTIILWLKSGVDIDEYLPKETLDWCILQLSMHNIDLSTLSGGDTITGGL